MNGVWLWSLLSLLIMSMGACDGDSSSDVESLWRCVEQNNTLQIYYGSGEHVPQVAVVHLDSSYMRLVVLDQTTWGTSFIVAPSFWFNKVLQQGCSVSYSYDKSANLVLHLSGRLPESGESYLSFQADITLFVPKEDRTRAKVSVSVINYGNLSLLLPVNIRQTEAFRPIFLSSMKVSSNQWDALSFVIGTGIPQTIPTLQGFFLDRPYLVKRFGLIGGKSDWQTIQPAPTMMVSDIDVDVYAQGWVTGSNDPNDDNVGYWVGSSQILFQWSYVIEASLDHQEGIGLLNWSGDN